MSRASRLSGFTTAISGDTDLNVGIVTAKQLNVNQSFTFTDINVTGVATANNLNVTGVSTLGNVVVGGATTDLVVNGNARVTGILTVGTSSLTLNGDSSTISGITTINSVSLPSTGALSNRNIIDNPKMVVNQRLPGIGNTLSGLQNSPQYVADRWSYRRSGDWGTNSFTMSQELLGDSGVMGPFTHYLRLEQSGTAASVPSGAFCSFNQNVEYNNVNVLNDGTSGTKEFTVSWYARGSRPGTYSMAIVASNSFDGNSHSYVTEYSLTSSWQRFSATVPAKTGGTFGREFVSHQAGLGIYYTAAGDQVGALSTTNTNAWNTADRRYSTNQENSFASTAGATFDITGVQVELGSQATDFEHRNISDELQRCRRYYQTFTAGGSGTATGASQTQSAQCTINYSPEMRAVPSITYGEMTTSTNSTGAVSTFVPRTVGHVAGAQSSASGRQFWGIGISTANADI